MMEYIRRGAQLCAPTDIVFQPFEKGYNSECNLKKGLSFIRFALQFSEIAIALLGNRFVGNQKSTWQKM
jgi:hypothetical protein